MRPTKRLKIKILEPASLDWIIYPDVEAQNHAAFILHRTPGSRHTAMVLHLFVQRHLELYFNIFNSLAQELSL